MFINRIYESKKIGKKIYLWGLGVQGLACLNKIEQEGIKIDGIVDMKAHEISRGFAFGYPMMTFEELQNKENISNVYFLIAVSTYKSIFSIEQTCKNAGLKEKDDYCYVGNRKMLFVDVSGRCNLKCPSCMVANHTEGSIAYDQRKFMSVEMFQKVIRKAKKDWQGCECVSLFNFGEPLLNPNIDKMIQIIREEKYSSVISTNLSVDIDLKKIVKVNPDIIKVSLSGYSQKIYETTHTGGDIRLVLSNMYKLKYYIDKYKSETKVLVGYHLYNNNREEGKKIKSICEELNFVYQPCEAIYNNIFKITGKEEFTLQDKEFISKYYPNPDIYLNNQDYGDATKECARITDFLFVDWDGKIILCCQTLHDKCLMGINYLDVSIEEIQEARKNHPVCVWCKENGFAEL